MILYKDVYFIYNKNIKRVWIQEISKNKNICIYWKYSISLREFDLPSSSLLFCIYRSSRVDHNIDVISGEDHVLLWSSVLLLMSVILWFECVSSTWAVFWDWHGPQTFPMDLEKFILGSWIGYGPGWNPPPTLGFRCRRRRSSLASPLVIFCLLLFVLCIFSDS